MICEQFSEIETTCRNSIERHLIDTVHFRQLCEYETIVIFIPILPVCLLSAVLVYCKTFY